MWKCEKREGKADKYVLNREPPTLNYTQLKFIKMLTSNIFSSICSIHLQDEVCEKCRMIYCPKDYCVF